MINFKYWTLISQRSAYCTYVKPSRIVKWIRYYTINHARQGLSIEKKPDQHWWEWQDQVGRKISKGRGPCNILPTQIGNTNNTALVVYPIGSCQLLPFWSLSPFLSFFFLLARSCHSIFFYSLLSLQDPYILFISQLLPFKFFSKIKLSISLWVCIGKKSLAIVHHLHR